jgi:hypothetical protein
MESSSGLRWAKRDALPRRATLDWPFDSSVFLAAALTAAFRAGALRVGAFLPVTFRAGIFRRAAFFAVFLAAVFRAGAFRAAGFRAGVFRAAAFFAAFLTAVFRAGVPRPRDRRTAPRETAFRADFRGRLSAALETRFGPFLLMTAL